MCVFVCVLFCIRQRFGTEINYLHRMRVVPLGERSRSRSRFNRTPEIHLVRACYINYCVGALLVVERGESVFGVGISAAQLQRQRQHEHVLQFMTNKDD